MKTRIISATLLTILLIAVDIFGGYVMFGFALCLSIMGMFELYRVLGIHKKVFAFSGYAIAIAYYALMLFGFEEYVSMWALIAGILTMMVYVIFFTKGYTAKDAAFSLLGVLYVAVPLSFFYRIRIMENGLFLYFMIFICSWISDTFAYFVGSAIGRHKLTPVLSPKKSIEGAIGGTLAGTIFAFVYAVILRGKLGVDYALPFTIIGFVGSIMSIFGDLAASAVKRNYDVKDYSNLIPGHGGILDRFDSMIFVTPIVYIGMFFMAKGV